MSNKMKNKRGVTPRLRFPEFRNAGEWEEKKLKDISSSIFDGTHQTPTYTTEGVPFYSVENIISGAKNKFISREDYIAATSKNKPEKDDILLTRIGKIGYSQVVTWDHDFSVYVTLAVIKKSKLFHPYYLQFFMQSSRYQTELRKKSLLTAVPPKINMDSLRSTIVLLPGLSEQQKIADCLTSLDDLIAAHTHKLNALTAHKKGLLQQLFPAPGQTLPRLRFPEFQDAGEWVEKRLLEVCDINPSNGGLPESFVYIDLESVVAGKLIYNKKIYRDDAPSRAQRLLKNGDVIYQIVRPYQRNNFFCDFDDENNYVASTGYAQLRSFDVSRFLYQLIHTDTFVNKVIAKCTGSSYPAINSSYLAEITVTIPKAPEQQKIAACLTSLDDQITAQTQKIDALNAHKKGLLQQLFPSPEEFKK